MTEAMLHEKPCLPSGLLQQVFAVLLIYLFIYFKLINEKV